MEITNIRAIELSGGQQIQQVESATLLDGGVLSVTSWTTNGDQIPLKDVSYLAANSWKRIILDLHSLVIWHGNNEREELVGLTPADVEREVYSRITQDGVDPEPATRYARAVARGDESLKGAGRSFYRFRLY